MTASLESVTNLIQLLPTAPGLPHWLTLRGADSVDFLVRKGGQIKATTYVYEDGRPPHTIESVEFDMNGVTVRAQRSRPATVGEVEAVRTAKNVYESDTRFRAVDVAL